MEFDPESNVMMHPEGLHFGDPQQIKMTIANIVRVSMSSYWQPDPGTPKSTYIQHLLKEQQNSRSDKI